MKKMVKKVLACALAAVLTVGAASSAMAAKSPTTGPKPVSKPNVTATNGEKVDTKKNGHVALSKVPATNKKQVTVASKVTVNGVKYTVTVVSAEAFSNAKKATKITLPATITKIKKNAFAGAKKLTTLKLQGKKVASMTIQKGAFKGLSTKKMTVRVSKNLTKKQYNKIVKKLRNAGFKGKVKKNL